MFAKEHQLNVMKTWALRAGGWFLMFIGITLCTRIIYTLGNTNTHTLSLIICVMHHFICLLATNLLICVFNQYFETFVSKYLYLSELDSDSRTRDSRLKKSDSYLRDSRLGFAEHSSWNCTSGNRYLILAPETQELTWTQASNN